MALGLPVIVYIEQKPGAFGETMNNIRAWLDHRKIQPTLFKVVDTCAGFEIAFAKEDEADLFKREFAALAQNAGLPSVGVRSPVMREGYRARLPARSREARSRRNG